MKEYVEYSNIEEFKNKIEILLNNKDLCKKIGEKGRIKMKNDHSPISRARYIMKIITNEEYS